MKKLFHYLLIIGFLWSMGYVYFLCAALSMQPEKTNTTANAIVVLTGGGERVEAGLSLFSSGRSTYLFISGVHPQVTEGEIRAMWKGGSGLPACCIILGRSAQTTEENAREVRDWGQQVGGLPSIRLVTANYHMRRARLEFSHAMPGVTIIPYPVVQADLKPFSKRHLLLVASEYNKWLVRFVSMTLRLT